LFDANPGVSRQTTLIIDDEADSASVGYSKKAGLIEARTIATQVSQMRSKLTTSAYLQVTATPYSLYLQPNEIEVANQVSFKPARPAFTKPVPVPAEYVGGDTYFGERAWSEGNTLESLIHLTVDHLEFDRLERHDGRSFKLDDVVTTPKLVGYRTAIVNFIVGGCIQRINGLKAGGKPKKLRYSFLLHSEAGKGAHEWQEEPTLNLIEKLKTSAADGEARSCCTLAPADWMPSAWPFCCGRTVCPPHS
jgi:hypothetical protein